MLIAKYEAQKYQIPTKEDNQKSKSFQQPSETIKYNQQTNQ